MNLFCIIGKSGSGKDTVFDCIVEKTGLEPVITYTTRPIRPGETDGKEYHFVKEIPDNNVIEERVYNTTQGLWYYALLDDGQFDRPNDKIMITTPAGIRAMKTWWADRHDIHIIPIMIDVPDNIRMERLKGREIRKPNPDFDEIKRRYKADQIDFAELPEGTAVMPNENLEFCVKMCLDFIEKKSQNIQ